jgi:hypothetical protein
MKELWDPPPPLHQCSIPALGIVYGFEHEEQGNNAKTKQEVSVPTTFKSFLLKKSSLVGSNTITVIGPMTFSKIQITFFGFMCFLVF